MTAPIQDPTAHPRERLHLLAELDRRSAEITADLRFMDERKLPISLNLADIEDGGMREVAGYRSLTSWARTVHHLPASTSSEWLSVGRACRRWPVLLERIRSGRVCWSNARELPRVVETTTTCPRGSTRPSGSGSRRSAARCRRSARHTRGRSTT